MLPTIGGNTLIYSGTLFPAGSVLAPDFVATVTSNDPAVSPTVDVTGLIVTVPLPTDWVENTTTPPHNHLRYLQRQHRAATYRHHHSGGSRSAGFQHHVCSDHLRQLYLVYDRLSIDHPSLRWIDAHR